MVNTYLDTSVENFLKSEWDSIGFFKIVLVESVIFREHVQF